MNRDFARRRTKRKKNTRQSEKMREKKRRIPKTKDGERKKKTEDK